MGDALQEALEREQRELADSQRLAEAQAQRVSDIRAVMSTPAGRRFVAGVIYELAGFASASFAADPHATAYNEGQRSIGISLKRDLERAASLLYIAMERERVEALADPVTAPDPVT